MDQIHHLVEIDESEATNKVFHLDPTIVFRIVIILIRVILFDKAISSF